MFVLIYLIPRYLYQFINQRFQIFLSLYLCQVYFRGCWFVGVIVTALPPFVFIEKKLIKESFHKNSCICNFQKQLNTIYDYKICLKFKIKCSKCQGREEKINGWVNKVLLHVALKMLLHYKYVLLYMDH